MRNKITTQIELVEEDERKKKLDDKKSKLRSEILKQIDDDEKQKSILEEEFKQAEEQQKNILLQNHKQQSLNENTNQFYNKDFINETNFGNMNREKGSYSDVIYKKARPDSNKDSSSNYNFNYAINNYCVVSFFGC